VYRAKRRLCWDINRYFSKIFVFLLEAKYLSDHPRGSVDRYWQDQYISVTGLCRSNTNAHKRPKNVALTALKLKKWYLKCIALVEQKKKVCHANSNAHKPPRNFLKSSIWTLISRKVSKPRSWDFRLKSLSFVRSASLLREYAHHQAIQNCGSCSFSVRKKC